MNYRILLIGLAALGMLLGGISLVKFADNSKNLTQPNTSTNILYLPSPVEIRVLSTNSAVWPKVFRPERPLEPEFIPEFYSLALREGGLHDLTPEQWEEVRRWSVALNSFHLNLLAQELPANPAKQSCSLFEQEAFYRRMQIRPELRRGFVLYMEHCDPGNVLSDWLLMSDAIERKETTMLERMTEKLRQRSFIPEKTWTMWFAGEAVKVGQLTLESWHPSQN